MNEKKVLTLNKNIISRFEKKENGEIIFYGPDNEIFEFPKSDNRESDLAKVVKKLKRIL